MKIFLQNLELNVLYRLYIYIVTPFINVSVLSELDPLPPSNIPLSITPKCNNYYSITPFHSSFVNSKNYLSLKCVESIRCDIENEQINSIFILLLN